MTTPLFFLALAALVVFTLLPLFKPWKPLLEGMDEREREVQTLERERAASLLALKDLEFERGAERMSDGDYKQHKDFHTRKAAEALRALEALKRESGVDKERERRFRALEQDKIASLRALKDLEFERATGKLSDEDYEELKDFYTRKAAESLQALEALKEEPGVQVGA